MNKKTFQEFVETRSELSLVNDVAYGIVGDFPVTITLLNNNPTITMQLAAEDIKRVTKDYKKALKGVAALQKGVGTLVVTLGANANNFEDKYNDFTQITLATFAENNVAPIKECPYCHSEGCDVMVQTATGYAMAHQTCVNDILNKEMAKAEKNSMQGNYFTGLIGAILGAIVGMIPNIFTLLVLERHIWLVYALIPLASYFGYKLLKGKLDGIGVGIIIVFSVILGVLTSIVATLYDLMVNYGRSMYNSLRLIINNITELAPDSAMSLLGVVIGIVIVWGRITATNKTVAKGNDVVRATMKPLTAATGNAGARPTMESSNTAERPTMATDMPSYYFDSAAEGTADNE